MLRTVHEDGLMFSVLTLSADLFKGKRRDSINEILVFFISLLTSFSLSQIYGVISEDHRS